MDPKEAKTTYIYSLIVRNLAKRVQKQDMVAFPTVEDAEQAIKNDPNTIIRWLLDIIDQMR